MVVAMRRASVGTTGVEAPAATPRTSAATRPPRGSSWTTTPWPSWRQRCSSARPSP